MWKYLKNGALIMFLLSATISIGSIVAICKFLF